MVSDMGGGSGGVSAVWEFYNTMIKDGRCYNSRGDRQKSCEESGENGCTKENPGIFTR
jgi:hypothetical protein